VTIYEDDTRLAPSESLHARRAREDDAILLVLELLSPLPHETLDELDIVHESDGTMWVTFCMDLHDQLLMKGRIRVGREAIAAYRARTR
jgi:hypothetical protein